VDGAHERQFEDNPGWRTEIQSARQTLRVARVLASLGVLRLVDLPLGEGSSSILPPGQRPAARALGFRASWVAAVAGETTALDQGLEVAARAIDALPTPPFPDLPVMVLTRDRPEGAEAKDYPQWLAVQRKLMAFSSRSVQQIVPGAGHFIQADRPQAVVDAVHSVLTQIGNATPN
jgi:pimeloyl-ACP methyl ester carboxylesterase